MVNKKIKYRLIIAFFLSIIFLAFNIFNPRYWVINDTGAAYVSCILMLLIFFIVEFVIFNDLIIKEKVAILILYLPIYALLLLSINSVVVYSSVSNGYEIIQNITYPKRGTNGCLLLKSKTSYLCSTDVADGEVKVFKAWNYLVIVPENKYTLIPVRD
jgi:hypothetical protein|tara:strand:- start:1433 stop:1906 length:474 start_codon:yes stop_codon:yes gene_type:complete